MIFDHPLNSFSLQDNYISNEFLDFWRDGLHESYFLPIRECEPTATLHITSFSNIPFFNRCTLQKWRGATAMQIDAAPSLTVSLCDANAIADLIDVSSMGIFALYCIFPFDFHRSI